MEHVYELVSIWPGGEYVHMRSEALPPVAARYNRCKARETYVRIRLDGRLLTIREADELCGEKWQIASGLPIGQKARTYTSLPITRNKRRDRAKRVAELDAAGHVLRVFESINDMAISLNTSTATAGLWIRQGDIRATGCKYAVCEGEEKANEAR